MKAGGEAGRNGVACSVRTPSFGRSALASAGEVAAQATQPRSRDEIDEALEVHARGWQPARELHDRPAHDAARGLVHLDAASMQEALDEQLLLIGRDVPTAPRPGKWN